MSVLEMLGVALIIAMFALGSRDTSRPARLDRCDGTISRLRRRAPFGEAASVAV
jgi:hypothetical protein